MQRIVPARFHPDTYTLHHIDILRIVSSSRIHPISFLFASIHPYICIADTGPHFMPHLPSISYIFLPLRHFTSMNTRSHSFVAIECFLPAFCAFKSSFLPRLGFDATIPFHASVTADPGLSFHSRNLVSCNSGCQTLVPVLESRSYPAIRKNCHD
jgi:hypothetical protein